MIQQIKVQMKIIRQERNGLTAKDGSTTPELKASIEVATDSIINTEKVNSSDFSFISSLSKESFIMDIPR